MKGKSLLLMSLSLLLALVVGGGIGGLWEEARAEVREAPGQIGPQPVGTAFTYQGRLLDGGNPVNDTCDFAFTLWDSLSMEPIGTQSKTGVTVTDGLFTVELDFGGGAFQGDARWLKIEVQCPGDPAFIELSPRQELTGTPYALYALGASWSGLTGMPAGFADGVDDDAPAGAVMFFDLPSCPAGWSELTGARGRVVVGLVSGGALSGTVGTALTNLEDRTHTHDVDPVSTNTVFAGSHSHTVNPPNTGTSSIGSHSHVVDPPATSSSTIYSSWERVVGFTDSQQYIIDVSSHYHTTDIPQFNSSYAGSHNHAVDIGAFSSDSAGSHSHPVDVPNTMSTSASTGDVIPYIQLLVCRKD